MYEKGGLIKEVEDRSKGLELSGVDRFRYRTRYFTDSGIIGTKEFVSQVYQGFKDYFSSKHEKRPRLIQGVARSLFPETTFGKHLEHETQPGQYLRDRQDGIIHKILQETELAGGRQNSSFSSRGRFTLVH